MNREERALAQEFETYLQDDLGIDRKMSRSKMITGVSCKLKIEKKPINRTTEKPRSVIWMVTVFAQAKDGRFEARAKAVYNMRQVGGRIGALRSLSSLLFNSLDNQETIEKQRLEHERVDIMADDSGESYQGAH